MSKLDTTFDRFFNALDTLETTVRERMQHHKTPEEIEERMANLSKDRDRLAGELDTMKADSKALEGLTDEISSKLELAIKDVQSILRQDNPREVSNNS